MDQKDIVRPAAVFLYGVSPVFEGALGECVTHWHNNLSSFGQTLARVRVQDNFGAYWLGAEELMCLTSKQSVSSR
jgi:hypothetical protein